MPDKINIYGAGLVGSLCASMLKLRGHQVAVFEKRLDLRGINAYKGRSINLALSDRGRKALQIVGLEEKVLETTVPMYGRVIHDPEGNTTFQSYSQNTEKCIYSVPRKRLNELLLNRAEGLGVKLHFESPLKSSLLQANAHIGADGANSQLREHISDHNHRYEALSHQYLEVDIPAADGKYAFEQYEALHIWPRKSFMFIALPNLDQTFTGTLFLAKTGDQSFERHKEELYDFFVKEFPDVIPLVPDLKQQLATNPISDLGTHYTENWSEDNKLIIGDAAHAIVPFYGQGMNAGFEDCTVLNEMIDTHPDWTQCFQTFAEKRKPDGDAIAELALYNFIEMRDKVAHDQFLSIQRISRHFHTQLGDDWIPLYEMVTFSHLPYSEALQRGNWQKEKIRELLNQYEEKELLELDSDQIRGLVQ